MNDSAKLQTGVEPIGHAEKVGKTLIYFFTRKNSKSPPQPWFSVSSTQQSQKLGISDSEP